MKIPRIFVVPIWIVILIIFSFFVGLISHWFGALNPQAWGFFTLIGIFSAFLLYILGRQIWWFVSGTGDYENRNGLLKRLWNKIFKK
jgi:uncharacterized membrane protein